MLRSPCSPLPLPGRAKARGHVPSQAASKTSLRDARGRARWMAMQVLVSMVVGHEASRRGGAIEKVPTRKLTSAVAAVRAPPPNAAQAPPCKAYDGT